ncbi:hypothetical protein [Arthrobacter sp. Leaf137]|uniref:hypothetical protein n=1 Tax=Arthrobacter sp. Leaf137 TaxID=1736271 RepID=UPI0012E17A2C|nr:hypothetical protein [Arthrobacter sp. Leaf137]
MTTGGRRTAPDPEFVLLYRQGTPTSKIATDAGVAATTVRYTCRSPRNRIRGSGTNTRQP